MGYDMRWANTDGVDPEPLRKAEEDFDAAVKIRNALPKGSVEEQEAQKQVTVAYDELNRADVAYFRLNIWGMSRCRNHMYEYGMCYVSQGPRSDEWPAYPEDAAEGSIEMLEYELAHAKLVSRPGGEMPGIPDHKLGSNDGWLVLPLECETAVEQWEKAGSPKPEEWFEEWVNFLREAAKHGGFKVH